jgi:hypothetical protein
MTAARPAAWPPELKRRSTLSFLAPQLWKNFPWRVVALPENAMKYLAVFVLIAFASSVQAADSACMAAAKEKKLAGAAQKSFVKKCEEDAKAKCELAAAEKKLSGAAKNSNVKKCVQETGPSG